MRRDPQRIAAEAANHVTIGFLQGAGFALATTVVGIFATVIATLLSGPGGILIAVIMGLVIYKKVRKKPQARQETGREVRTKSQAREQADGELAFIEAQELEFKAAVAMSAKGPAKK